MPTTSRGYRYPSSTDDVRPYEDIQFLASDVNTDVAALAAPPIAVLRQTVAQTLTNGTFTALTFTTEDIDTANGHSTSTNTSRYTCQVAGKYMLTGGVTFASNGTGARYARWRVNGADVSGGGTSMPGISGDQALLPARTVIVALNVGDYVELWAYQGSGGNLDTYVGVTYAQSTVTVMRVSS